MLDLEGIQWQNESLEDYFIAFEKKADGHKTPATKRLDVLLQLMSEALKQAHVRVYKAEGHFQTPLPTFSIRCFL